ncbi:MAG: NAD-dependent epimerase/dehydratase family protein [Chloroflexota bacterium]
MSNSNQVVLVTGGTGFTGSHLVKRLLSRGHEVRVLDNQEGLFFDELKEMGACITLGSVTDRELLDELVQGCDVVHHLAAAFRVINDPKEVYWEVNVEGTRYLLEAAHKHGVQKFVYCSTQGVHGHVENPPGNEESPIAPADYYQYTKHEGEKVAHEFMEKGMNITILRPTAIYGPGDPGRWLMLFKHTANGRFLMFGNGKTTYHPVYIDNLVDAFELSVEREEARGQTYIIGDREYYPLRDLVKMVGEAQGKDVSIVRLPFWPLWTAALLTEIVCAPFGIEPPLFRRRVDWFRQMRAFDISKAVNELGYEAEVDLPTGLARTAEWYRANGYL